MSIDKKIKLIYDEKCGIVLPDYKIDAFINKTINAFKSGRSYIEIRFNQNLVLLGFRVYVAKKKIKNEDIMIITPSGVIELNEEGRILNDANVPRDLDLFDHYLDKLLNLGD